MALVKASTGLDMPAAEAAAEEAVAKLGPDPAPSARRHLAALFAGSGNLGSATVQWLRLPKAERKAGDGLTPELVEELDQMAVRKNENYLIAATLAASRPPLPPMVGSFSITTRSAAASSDAPQYSICAATS